MESWVGDADVAQSAADERAARGFTSHWPTVRSPEGPHPPRYHDG